MGLKEEFDKIDKLDPTEVAGVANLTLFNKISGPRLHLVMTQLGQSLMLDNPEIPKMYTGYEKQFGLVNSSLKIAKTNYKILARIEKYVNNPGYHYTLVLRDEATGIISIVENKHYESLTEDHGYIRPQCPIDSVPPGTIIPAGTIISKSNSHDDALNYRYGVNAKVAYISRKENIEDGIPISESFSKRVTYNEISTFEITLGFNDVLLNTYGDDSIYKTFPDIFETTNNGIFCTKRSINNDRLACELSNEALKTPNTGDSHFKADGTLLDIDVYINAPLELNVTNNPHRNQIITYYNLNKTYKQNIVNVLKKYINNKRYRVTVNAQSTYHQYKNFIDSESLIGTDIKYANSKGVFEFALLKVVVGKKVHLKCGSKLTNRFGGKGVVSKIIPDEYMPTDENGVVADMIINPASIIGRANPGQLFEHELNFLGSRVVDMIKSTNTLAQKFRIINKFFNMVDKGFAQLLKNDYNKMDLASKHRFFTDIEVNGLRIYQHPFNNISFDGLKAIYKEFNIKPSRVKIGLELDNGKVIKSKTVNDVIIADQYVTVLKHTTSSKFSAVSVSSVNSMGLPHKKVVKQNAPHKMTPIANGSMETDVEINRVDPKLVNRFLAGHGSNLKHRTAVASMLLSEDPFCYHDVPVTDDEVTNNIASDAFVAILKQLGYVVYADEKTTEIKIGVKP